MEVRIFLYANRITGVYEIKEERIIRTLFIEKKFYNSQKTIEEGSVKDVCIK